MLLDFDFDSIESADDVEFNEIPTGDYLIKLEESSIDETRNPPRISMQFEIVNSDFKGRKVWTNYNLNEKGAPFLKRDLHYLGSTENITKDNLLAEITKPVGKEIEASISPRVYNGKTYYNVYLKNPNNKKEENVAGFDSADGIPF